MVHDIPCPHCGEPVTVHRNPVPTVDILVFDPHCGPRGGVVLVRRANEPVGWAIPGGFVDYGETVEQAAIREAREETGLNVTLTGLVGVYSDPRRDRRMHTLSVAYAAVAGNMAELQGADDAAEARCFPLGEWPDPVVFDHLVILRDFERGFVRLNGTPDGYPGAEW